MEPLNGQINEILSQVGGGMQKNSAGCGNLKYAAGWLENGRLENAADCWTLPAWHEVHSSKSSVPSPPRPLPHNLFSALQITQQCTALINTTATSGTAQRRSLMATNIKITSRVQSNDPAVGACCFRTVAWLCAAAASPCHL